MFQQQSTVLLDNLHGIERQQQHQQEEKYLTQLLHITFDAITTTTISATLMTGAIEDAIAGGIAGVKVNNQPLDTETNNKKQR